MSTKIDQVEFELHTAHVARCLAITLLCSAICLWSIFTARRYAKRGICRRRVSVRPSVCVCVCVCVCHHKWPINVGYYHIFEHNAQTPLNRSVVYMLYSQHCNKYSDKSNRWSLGLSLSVGGPKRRRCDKQYSVVAPLLIAIRQYRG